MQITTILLIVGSLLTLAGCGSGTEDCRKDYPSGSAAYQACWSAVIQRQNEQLNQTEALEYRARD
jgi:hypothetical protein